MKTAVEIAMEKDTGYVPHGKSREELIAFISSAPLGEEYEKLSSEEVVKFGEFVYGVSNPEEMSWSWADLDKLTDAELEFLYWRLV